MRAGRTVGTAGDGHLREEPRAVKISRYRTRAARSAAWVAVVLAVAACGSKQTPVDELTPEDLWLRGIEAYQEEDWADAIRYFDRFALVSGTDPRGAQARYYVGQAQFAREEYVAAATTFTQLATDLARTDLADDSRFMACRSYEELAPQPQLDQEYTRAAIDHCQALLEYFPDTEYAPRAREIVDRMTARLATKAYESGAWYLRRGAYDSAIIYFEDVLDRYPQTEVAPRALVRLMEIYERLEWEEERQEIRDRLLREYPESPEAQALGRG